MHMEIDSGTSARPSIHRQVRDLDILLFLGLALFVFCEYSGYIKKEEVAFIDPILEKDNEGVKFGVPSTSNITGEAIDTRPSIAVNWKHVLNHQNECSLSFEEEAPLPLVFMALGRTGSSITWQAIASIFSDNKSPPKAIEIVGRVKEESVEFFENIPDQLASNWPSAYICDLQRNFTTTKENPGLVGFQWKPYQISLNDPKSLGGMSDLANTYLNNENEQSNTYLTKETSAHEKIKVIYQTRNPIDRRLSNWRHHGHKADVPAHCPVGDEECLKQHEKYDAKKNFTTGNELLHWLKQDDKHHKNIIRQLEKIGVDYVYVTYEKLYSSENDEGSKEWKRIFEFLGRGPDKFTMDTIREHFGMVKTSSKTHKDAMLNYEDVKETLKGTKFENYLN